VPHLRDPRSLKRCRLSGNLLCCRARGGDRLDAQRIYIHLSRCEKKPDLTFSPAQMLHARGSVW